jgi:hypothetical protein
MRLLLFLVSFAFLQLSCNSSLKQTVLFNGQDLDGWTIHGTEKWYVEDGELVCESGPQAEYGYLSTDQFYDDFELTLEFRQEADGNSGVFFRSVSQLRSFTMARFFIPRVGTRG